MKIPGIKNLELQFSKIFFTSLARQTKQFVNIYLRILVMKLFFYVTVKLLFN